MGGRGNRRDDILPDGRLAAHVRINRKYEQHISLLPYGTSQIIVTIALALVIILTAIILWVPEARSPLPLRLHAVRNASQAFAARRDDRNQSFLSRPFAPSFRQYARRPYHNQGICWGSSPHSDPRRARRRRCPSTKCSRHGAIGDQQGFF